MEQFLLNFALISSTVLVQNIQGWAIVLDKGQDANTVMWKLTGTLYIDNGIDLRGPIHKHLPDDFEFNNFALSKGIWAVVPAEPDCDLFNIPSFESFDEPSSKESTKTTSKPCNVTSTGSFQFKSMAQLASSVKVKYTFGGNSSIRITGAKGEPYEDSANGRRFGNWINIEVPLEGSRSMKFDATVYSDNSYVLVDTITIQIQEASTSPRTKRTTTTEAPATPAGGPQTHSALSLPLFMTSCALLAHYLLTSY